MKTVAIQATGYEGGALVAVVEIQDGVVLSELLLEFLKEFGHPTAQEYHLALRNFTPVPTSDGEPPSGKEIRNDIWATAEEAWKRMAARYGEHIRPADGFIYWLEEKGLAKRIPHENEYISDYYA